MSENYEKLKAQKARIENRQLRKTLTEFMLWMQADFGGGKTLDAETKQLIKNFIKSRGREAGGRGE